MFRFFVYVLVSNLVKGQHSLREVLLTEEDLQLAQDKPGTASITTLHGCFLVPSRTGCTGWKERVCQREKKVGYEDNCTLQGGRMLKNCQTSSERVPTETSLTTCGTRVERQCQGPCYNCKTNCRPQFERTCWVNHVVKTVENVLRQGGVDYYQEKSRIENVNSCSESRIGDICAPVNCRFINTDEECMHKNQTEIINLKSRTCELCIQMITEVVVEGSCIDRVRKDCRERFPVAWTKFCNTNHTEEDLEKENVVNDILISEEPRSLQSDLFTNSVNPVNNLIYETLRKLSLKDLDKDTVIVIPTPGTDSSPKLNDVLHVLEQEEEVDVLHVLEQEEEVDVLHVLEQKEEVDVLHVLEQKEEKKDDSMNINVNVKYEFDDLPAIAQGLNPSSINKQLEESSFTTNLNNLDSDRDTSKEENAIFQGPIETSVTDTRNLETKSEKNYEESKKNDQDDIFDEIYKAEEPKRKTAETNTYFNPLLQVLNDRERNEISAVETPTTTTSLQISFPEISPVFPQLFYTSTTDSNVDGFETSQSAGTVYSPSSASIRTTTAQPVQSVQSVQSTSAEPETESTALKAEATTTTTTTVTLTTTTSAEPITTTITTEPTTTTITTASTTTVSTTEAIHVALSYRDQIKMCFLYNINCDFSSNSKEQRQSPTTTRTTTTSTTTTTTTTTPTTESSEESRSGKYHLDAHQKFKICFEYGICSEDEIIEHLQRRNSEHAETRPAELSRSSPPVLRSPPRSSYKPKREDRLSGIKARATACIFNGVC